jgi:hypothetical protein
VIAALAQTVRDVFADPEAWRRRGEEGRHRAEQRYALGYQNRTSIAPLSSHSRQRQWARGGVTGPPCEAHSCIGTMLCIMAMVPAVDGTGESCRDESLPGTAGVDICL